VHRGRRRARAARNAVALAAVLAGLVAAVPVAAVVARLRTIPLGHGTATIVWTGRSGLHPTVTSVSGTAGGYHVVASATTPALSGAAGSLTTGSVSLPSSVTLAHVTGELGGAAFTFDIDLDLAHAGLGSGSGTGTGTPIATVHGTFRGEPVAATVSAVSARSQFVRFHGTIGPDVVAGTIGPPQHRGTTTTAHASFVVTRG
jgi:hypothetical protein